MAKSSGGTRSQDKAHRSPSSGASYGKFKDNGGGNLILDTKKGGGQVLVSNDVFNDYKYGTRKVYEATPWDSKNNVGEKKVFTSLSDAKKYAKSKMK